MELSKRTFALLLLGTLLLLLYVHEQVSIFRVSYSIERKEREVARLSEDYKSAKFYLTRLRSPHALTQRMKTLSVDLTTPRDQEVIKILKPKAAEPKTEVIWPAPFQFLSWLHFIREAHAKTSK